MRQKVGCLHGKEGRRFEAVKGLCKSSALRGFVGIDLQVLERCVGREPFVERSGQTAVAGGLLTTSLASTFLWRQADAASSCSALDPGLRVQ
jgi:hypothetical protein